MKKFIFSGLFASIMISGLISPFACTAPDGLEYVAIAKNFMSKAVITPAIHGILPDYTVSCISNSGLSTSIAGLTGTLLTFISALFIGKILTKKNTTPKQLQATKD
ncbi:MAG: hypothetical protein DKM50_11225 [Candidatus Margulisiibacteriota bacterium]|nr:MAG: hypothetical protein A2X43_12280 [Candidatus Margulisbacteria bacterium GWD2_39_127]OGI03231.1 MAG: hypothetical protein A2X42_11520 [Candidatus Margulisbacteria bacterium GWF2_38_17]OGI11254.1 MAG: hypothetical protein A2X41_03945 [Candidatus Margulisbacteria bacterium GWE2_39_32]PZM78527.1 MAG: hypothetical protein DKM50_11225 [Candidatus Margulisiibacteriota bacterium]HAR63907.1 hypothetical protein [Candidatus Margulisiibacteriota bacterium]